MSMQLYSDDEEDKDAEGNELGNIMITGGRDSVILAIECCKELFEMEDSTSSFSRAINAIHEMFLNKIITSEKDLHGILFFGTKQSKNSSDFSNIVEWLKVDVPSIHSISELRRMQECDIATFENEFGFQSGHQISEVLWACLNMFSEKTSKLASKTLLFFAWDDNPHFGDDNARKRAKAKAMDLQEHGVDLQVLSFNKEFKYDKFYKDIATDPNNSDPDANNPIDCIQNMYSFLLRKSTKQRPYTRLSLRLGKDLEVGVGVYTTIRRTTKTAAVHIDSNTNHEVKRHASLVERNTGDILMPSDIKYMQKWGGREIVFEKEEIKEMKKVGQQGLNLLGFKPRRDAIKPWYHVKNAQFIYPDETSIKGSSTLFTSLLRKCNEKDVVAICSYSARESSQPKCVALLPQMEEVDPDTSEQIQPPGFYIVTLPFADDIRTIDIERGLPEPSQEQVEAAEAMTRHLRFSYHPDNFDNPVIQTHYKNLEAMALNKDQPDPIDNHTVPDYDAIETKAGSYIRTFKDLVFPPEYQQKMAQSATQSSKKKSNDMMQIDVKEYIAEGKLASLTVASLKEICQVNRIKSSGKKANIISAIENHF